MAARARARLVDPRRLGQALFARCPPLLVATEQPDLGTSIDQRRTAADVQIRRQCVPWVRGKAADCSTLRDMAVSGWVLLAAAGHFVWHTQPSLRAVGAGPPVTVQWPCPGPASRRVPASCPAPPGVGPVSATRLSRRPGPGAARSDWGGPGNGC